jgi:hypothetical protein
VLWASPEVPPLQYQKWQAAWGVGPRGDAVFYGQRPRDLYSVLQGIGASSTSKLMVMTGKQPWQCVCGCVSAWPRKCEHF